MSLKVIIQVSILVSMASCVSMPALTAAGSKVKVQTAYPTEDCEELGYVTGESSVHTGYNWKSDSKSQHMEHARNELRNNAGELGASVIVLETDTGGPGTILLTGQAYKCE